jgi:hypothetical protein
LFGFFAFDGLKVEVQSEMRGDEQDENAHHDFTDMVNPHKMPFVFPFVFKGFLRFGFKP